MARKRGFLIIFPPVYSILVHTTKLTVLYRGLSFGRATLVQWLIRLGKHKTLTDYA